MVLGLLGVRVQSTLTLSTKPGLTPSTDGCGPRPPPQRHIVFEQATLKVEKMIYVALSSLTTQN